MRNLEFLAIIKDCLIIPPKGLGAFLRGHEGKQVKIILSENIKKRSLSQNSFYWAVVLPHVRQFRMDNGDTVSKEQVHEDLLAEFSPQVESKNLKAEIVWRNLRSHEMDTKQMADYCTAIIARLSEFGYYVPLEGEAA